MPNNRFRKLAGLLSANLDAIRAVENNEDYTRAYRYAEAHRLMAQRNAAIQAEAENIVATYQQDIESARKKAFSGSKPVSDQAEMVHELRLSRHERHLTQKWAQESPPTAEDYAAAVESGDVALQETYESLAPLYTPPAEREQLRDVLSDGRRQREVQNMNDSQRVAFDEAQRLEADLDSVKTNLPVQMPAILSGEAELMDPTASGKDFGAEV